MIYENEIIMLILGCGVLLFMWKIRCQLKRLPMPKILFASYYILFAAWVLTVLEGFFWANFLNYLEHGAYAVSAILLAIWCRYAFTPKGAG